MYIFCLFKESANAPSTVNKDMAPGPSHIAPFQPPPRRNGEHIVTSLSITNFQIDEGTGIASPTFTTDIHRPNKQETESRHDSHIVDLTETSDEETEQ